MNDLTFTHYFLCHQTVWWVPKLSAAPKPIKDLRADGIPSLFFDKIKPNLSITFSSCSELHAYVTGKKMIKKINIMAKYRIKERNVQIQLS